VALGRQQHHLVAGAGLGVVGGPVALVELRLGLLVQAHPHWRGKTPTQVCPQRANGP
jgi:hypothetical protein